MQSYGFAKRRILVVDDDAFIAECTSAVFLREGYETKTAYSAELAIHLIRNWSPELAILDVHLAKMSGVDLAMRIEDDHPDCKFLLFSGAPSSDLLIERAEELGLKCAYLRKPAPPETLLATAHELLKPSLRSL